jgi:hypothetical protein
MAGRRGRHQEAGGYPATSPPLEQPLGTALPTVIHRVKYMLSVGFASDREKEISRGLFRTEPKIRCNDYAVLVCRGGSAIHAARKFWPLSGRQLRSAWELQRCNVVKASKVRLAMDKFDVLSTLAEQIHLLLAGSSIRCDFLWGARRRSDHITKQ